MKEILRCFRKRIKQVYLKTLNGSNKSKWKDSRKRQHTREFMTLPSESHLCLMIPEDFYDKHEAVLFSFINNTVKFNEIKDNFEIKQDPFTEVMRDVFGGHPNRDNLKQFFRHEAIHCLWWKQLELTQSQKQSIKGSKVTRFSEFFHSEELKKLVSELNPRQRKQLQNHTSKYCPTGYNLLPQ